MLSQAQRTAILELSVKGVSKREISHVLQLSRLTVRKVLRANSIDVPEIQRAEKAEPYRERIIELLTSCQGNLVRVHEELVADGAELSYQALTGFCRRAGIGQTKAGNTALPQVEQFCCQYRSGYGKVWQTHE
jgi:transposase